MMEQGVCPKCLSEELNYAKVRVDTSELKIEYPFKCTNCGFEGLEVYHAEFDCFLNKDRTEVVE